MSVTSYTKTKIDQLLAAITPTSIGAATPASVTSAVTAASTTDRQRANHTGTQTSTTISDFTEAVEDAVAALLGRSTQVGITFTYDDATGTLSATATGGGSGGLDAEGARDAVNAQFVGAGLISVAVNDAADTVTFSTTATQNSTDAALRDRSTHTGTQTLATISDAGTAASKNTGTSSGELALLGTGGRFPAGLLGSGTTDATTILYGDGTYKTAPTGGTTPLEPTGTDDTTALQSAIATAAASGRVLVLKRGATYLISTALTLPSNFTLEGNQALIQVKPGSNTHAITNADTTNGNTRITIRNLCVDANGANQTVDTNGLDFTSVTGCLFDNLDVKGGRRSQPSPAGTNGEGIVLRLSDNNEIRGGYYHDNDYDGIKLRNSDYNRIVAPVCENNGRSGVQLSFNVTGEGVFTEGSNYNEIINPIVKHSTGTPGPGAPTTSGVYIHTGAFNVVTGLHAYGVRQGIGLFAGANDNVFNGGAIRIRYSSTGSKAAIDLEATGPNNRNNFIGIMCRGLSGNAGIHVSVSGTNSINRFVGCSFAKGDGTGVWTMSTSSNAANNEFLLCYHDATVTDAGTKTVWLGATTNDFLGNITLFPNADPAGGQRTIPIKNTVGAPTGTPVGGGVLYVEAGALKFKGSSGTVTTIGAA